MIYQTPEVYTSSNLEQSIITFKLPTLSVKSEENGRCVNMVYGVCQGSRGSLRRLSGGSVWLGCLAGRPEAQRRPPPCSLPGDHPIHPPTTKPADGDGRRTDWRGLLSKMFSENNRDVSTMNKTQGCDSCLTPPALHFSSRTQHGVFHT